MSDNVNVLIQRMSHDKSKVPRQGKQAADTHLGGTPAPNEPPPNRYSPSNRSQANMSLLESAAGGNLASDKAI